MADRLIKVLTQGRCVAAGASRISSNTVSFGAADTDKGTVKIDYTRWLGSDTLSTITTTASGLTVSASTATPATTLTLSAASGAAYVEVVALSSGGRKHTLWINVNETDRAGEAPVRDYAG